MRLKKSKSSKSLFLIIGSFLIIFGISIIILKIILDYHFIQNRNSLVDEYLEVTSNEKNDVIYNSPESEIKESKDISDSERYLGVLEIPSIELKMGFFDIDSSLNTVDKNIEVLEMTNMSGTEHSFLVLASHSGSGRYAYFKNLYKLDSEDWVMIYYNGLKYTYKVSLKEYQEKTGKITINSGDNDLLILTTCDQEDRSKQIVIIATLIYKMPY